MADLQNDEVAFRKFRLISEEVQGRNVLTNFHGMDMTTDKLRSMVKKWQVSSVHTKTRPQCVMKACNFWKTSNRSTREFQDENCPSLPAEVSKLVTNDTPMTSITS